MSIFDDTIGMFTRAVGIEPSQLPVVGGLFSDPAEEAHAAQMRIVAQGLGAYREPMAQSQTNAINQSLGAYAPANTMMGMMYGPQMQMDFDAMGASPLAPGQIPDGSQPGPGLGADAMVDSLGAFPNALGGFPSPMAQGYPADPLKGRG